ncbi:MAG: tributyrin esterase [Methanobacteriaceae archaeon]
MKSDNGYKTDKLDEISVDAANLTPRELNSKIRELATGYNKIIIKNPNAAHYLLAGIVYSKCNSNSNNDSPYNGNSNSNFPDNDFKCLEIEIDGSAGYFVGTMIDNVKVKIKGNAGWFAADNMTSGEMIIDGSAGDGVGQGIYGGTVVVNRSAGSRTGEIMKNGTIIIGGDSGFMTGLLQMGGKIIVLGNIGEDAGESMLRGTIYVKGDVKSLGKNTKISDVNNNDKDELKEVLENYGFKLDNNDYNSFRKIESTKSSLHDHDSEILS